MYQHYFRIFLCLFLLVGPTSVLAQSESSREKVKYTEEGILPESPWSVLRVTKNIVQNLERTVSVLEKITPYAERFNNTATLGQYDRTKELIDQAVERSVRNIKENGQSTESVVAAMGDVLTASAEGTARAVAGATVTGLTFGKTSLLGKQSVQRTFGALHGTSSLTPPPFSHAQIRKKFDELARTHLVPRYRQIDPKMQFGYTGSFQTGFVGNPTKKKKFGKPIDLSNYDIDFWIKSKPLHNGYSNGLHADVPFRELLRRQREFMGLRPGKDGFSIKFLPAQ